MSTRTVNGHDVPIVIPFDSIADAETRWLVKFASWIDAAAEDAWRCGDNAAAVKLGLQAAECCNEVCRRLTPDAPAPQIVLAIA